MSTFKKIVKIIFGQATPFQLFLACLFGSILGFIPGFSYSPLISILLIFLVLILNVNIGFVVIVFIITKIISYIIEFFIFQVGVFLLTGFTQPVFKFMVNTPVLAYSGFEYYLVTGSIFVGIIFGLILGIIVVKLFKHVRDRMALLQENSELYQRMINKFWIKILTWVLLGKAANKVDWVELKDKKLKHPFRLSGIIIVLVVIILLFVLQSLLQKEMITNILKTQLEKINGSTVDLQGVNINLSDAKLTIKGLAISDPNKLNHDRVFAKELVAKLNIKELLTKRLVIYNMVIGHVETNHKRAYKAKLFIKEIDHKTEPPSSTQHTASQPSNSQNISSTSEVKVFKVKQYIKNAKKWQGYLVQAKRLLTRLNKKNDSSIKETPTNQAWMYGYANAIDNDLIEKTSTLTIEQLQIKNLSTKIANNSSFSVQAVNLATQPYLLKKPTVVTIQSHNKDIYVRLNQQNINPKNTIILKMNNLPAKALFENIKFKQNFKISSKSMNISSKGKWGFNNVDNVAINLPVKLVLNNAKISTKSFNKEIDTIPLTLTVRNTLDNPIIEFKADQLKKILLNAGTSEIKQQLKNKLKGKLPKSLPFNF